MALSNIIKTGLDAGTIVLKDGTATPLEATLRFDHGNLTISGVEPGQRAVVPIQSRGVLRSLRKGERTFPTGSVTLYVTEFSETGTGTILDLLYGKAGTPYASRVSTTATKGDVMTFDMVLTEEGTDYGDSADHDLTWEDVHFTYDYAQQSEGNTITLNFTVYGSLDGDQTDTL